MRIGTYHPPKGYPVKNPGSGSDSMVPAPPVVDMQTWADSGFSRFPVFTLDTATFNAIRQCGLKAEVYGCNLATVNWLRNHNYLDIVEWICGPDEPNPISYPVGSQQYQEMKLNIAYAQRFGMKVMVNLSAWWAFAPAERYAEYAAPYWDDWGADTCGTDFYPFYWHDLSGTYPDGDYQTSAMLASCIKRFNGGRPALWYMEAGAFEDNPGMDIYPATSLWPDVPKQWMINCLTGLRATGIENVNLFFYNIDYGANCKALTYGTPQWANVVNAVKTINAGNQTFTNWTRMLRRTTSMALNRFSIAGLLRKPTTGETQ